MSLLKISITFYIPVLVEILAGPLKLTYQLHQCLFQLPVMERSIFHVGGPDNVVS